jgi:hypothetical protein
VEGRLVDGRVLVAAADLPAALGWELKAEGLCRGDLCVPVRDRSPLVDGDRVDLAAVAGALDRPVAVDPDASLVAVGTPRGVRRQMLSGSRAPAFELPDLTGTLRSLEEFTDRKKLLFAFASW